MRFERAYYVCPHCRQGQSPHDAELDVVRTACSPGVCRMMALVGSETSFQQDREQPEVLAGLEVTAQAVERQAEALGADIAGREQVEIQRAKQLGLPQVCAPAVALLYLEMDGAGVPVLASESAGRGGKTAGQPARTREVKLGCIFTQTTTDEQGRPLRDQNSTTYTAAIEGADEFGLGLYSEAWRRGCSRALILGDGAVWIWNLADQHFPGRDSDRGSLPGATAPLGIVRETVPERAAAAQPLEVPPRDLTGSRGRGVDRDE